MKSPTAFHPLVKFDLVAASTWYDLQQPGLGQRFEALAQSVMTRLPDEALLYNVRFGDIRRVNLSPFPYGIFYFVERDQVVVLAVLHGVQETRKELEKRRGAFG